MELEFIKDTSSWDSGGGITLDLVELKDGRILAISEEIVILYRDMEDLVSGEASDPRPTIDLA